MFLVSNVQIFYTVSEIVFHKSEQKSAFQSYIVVISVIFYYYSRTYPHVNLVPIKFAFTMKLFSLFVSSLSNLAITFENFKFTVNQGWATYISQCIIQMLIARKEGKLTKKINRRLMGHYEYLKSEPRVDPTILLPSIVRVTH